MASREFMERRHESGRDRHRSHSQLVRSKYVSRGPIPAAASVRHVALPPWPDPHWPRGVVMEDSAQLFDPRVCVLDPVGRSAYGESAAIFPRGSTDDPEATVHNCTTRDTRGPHIRAPEICNGPTTIATA